MSSSTGAKDSSLLNEAVEFLSSPNTDWADPNESTQEASEKGADRSELRFMIARKRHNDAVRLAELSLLRRIRQEGLTGDQIREKEQAQGFDRPGHHPKARGAERPADAGAPSPWPGQAPAVRSYEADTIVLPLRELSGKDQEGPYVADGISGPTSPIGSPAPAGRPGRSERAERSAAILPKVKPTERSSPTEATEAAERANGAGQAQRTAGRSAGPGLPTEREEVTHDAELDQPAIAFANADFGGCESALRELVGPGGSRQRHLPTWRALLDLYRATGQQPGFERTAAAYMRDLGQKPPEWVSIPRLAMNMAEPARTAPAPSAMDPERAHAAPPTWQCPTLLDAAAVSSMQAFAQRCGSVPVIDWTLAKVLTLEGAQSLYAEIQACAARPVRLVWKGAPVLLDLLQHTPRSEGRTEDEVLWQARLALLRLMGVQGLYDFVAADFAAAYGRAAPAWAPTVAKIISGENWSPLAAPPGADFANSNLYDPRHAPSEVTVELLGQLTGDISDTLAKTLSDIEGAKAVLVDCARLIRVDLMAAGELSNWLGARRSEGRLVRFVGIHRLLALFFCAMGLDDQATIELRPL
jgi:anti-anti-sigma regulatory factor